MGSLNRPSLIPELEFMNTLYRNQCMFCNSTDIRCRGHFSEYFSAFYSKRLTYYEVGRSNNLVQIDTDYNHSFFCVLDNLCRHARCYHCRRSIHHNEITERRQYLRITYSGYWIVDVLRSFLRSIWRNQRQEPEEDVVMIRRSPTRDIVPRIED